MTHAPLIHPLPHPIDLLALQQHDPARFPLTTVEITGDLDHIDRVALERRLLPAAAGGVFRMNVNERSSKIVIWAGMIWPALSAVFSLYDFVNSTMLMPCGPRAVPTGGAGVALPAGS